ncbi:hypothetical protein T05_715 [Trichinella murrelli]|uniref:Uncharacterized protein n=1 Tax=Trichinella murrelli TaxID=144512 RepID=A0A0V0SR52_9BILA|nr:hypothetical protein T05_715 [Trichinella murrelli]
MDGIKIQNPKADIVPEFQGKFTLIESCTPVNGQKRISLKLPMFM